jgi:hypothetical protein
MFGQFDDSVLEGALVIEDNGSTGDRFDVVLRDGGELCPQADAALIGTGMVGHPGAVTSGDH